MDPYDFAIAQAKKVGDMLLVARQEGLEVMSKGGNARDIVTNVDLKANKMLLVAITEAFPEHGIVSEEGGGVLSGSDYQWTLDPIDGSSNFSRGIPHFAVSIGLLKNGTPELGAIFNPVTNELFSFKKGRGAFLNNQPLRPSAVEHLDKAQVIFSPGSRQRELWDWAAQSFRRLLEHAPKRGMYGSSALDLCFVAAGRADAGVYGTLNTLDVAAAIGLLKEAGGVLCDGSGTAPALLSTPQKIFFANTQTVLEELRLLIEN